MIITPGGNRLIVHFFTGILEHFSEVDSFQVVQETIDSIVIRIVPTKHFSPDSPGRIISTLQENGASGIRIEIELVNQIPSTPGGKRRFVISKVAKSIISNATPSVTNDGEHKGAADVA